MHTCSRCDAMFTDLANLIRHMRTVHAVAGGFTCQKCNYRTARKDNLRRHVKSKHSAANGTPVPNIIDPGNDISAQYIELMELTHDVAFSQCSDLLQISDDEQPPIKSLFEDFFSDHPKPWANNEHPKENYHEHFIQMFGGNPKPWTGDDQLKKSVPTSF